MSTKSVIKLTIKQSKLNILQTSMQTSSKKSSNIIDKILTSSSHLTAKVKLINETSNQKDNTDHQINRLSELFEKFVKLNGKINSDILSTISEITDPSILTDTIINHLLLNIEEKQSFLEIIEPLQRVEKLIVKIDTEISVLVSEKKVRSRVKKQMEKTQREYYLNEQLKAIQKELGSSEDGKDEFDEIEDKIKSAN